jgi:DNA-binding CsgD family transcriptional regulator
MKTQLPAGLIDDNVEIFDNGKGRAKATYMGVTIDFTQLPGKIYYAFYRRMILNTEAYSALSNVHRTEQSKMNQYLCCQFGAFDNVPDFEKGQIRADHFGCKIAGNCPYGEKVCPKFEAKNGELSRRELKVMSLIGQGKQAKEIADVLKISTTTAQTHLRNIRVKLGVNNATEVAGFAHNYNLV